MLINSYMFATASIPWTPAQITTALWLDAADAATVTTVSGAVSQWSDKSGNGRNATQPTAGLRPAYTSSGLNGLSVVTFDGADDILGFADRTLAKNVGAISYFFVAIPNSPSSADYRALFDLSTNPSPDRASVYLRSSTIEAGGRRLDADSYQFVQAGSTTTSACIGATVFNYTSAALSIGFNGATPVSRSGGFQSAGSTSNTDSLGINIGASGDAGVSFTAATAGACNCRVAEFIALQSAASDTTRQLIEGYLAHKWGLTANLPADHPYKSTAPTV